MSLILQSTFGRYTSPDVLVRNGVSVFCCNIDGAMGERTGALACPSNRKRRLNIYSSTEKREEERNKDLPFFEFLAVGIIFYTANHEISQVAVFMCYHVYETVLRYGQLITIILRLGLS